MDFIPKLFAKNELIVAFLVVGLIMLVSVFISQKLLRNKIPGAAVAITLGLVLAYFGGKKGIADIPL
jgi:hypothetical protein